MPRRSKRLMSKALSKTKINKAMLGTNAEENTSVLEVENPGSSPADSDNEKTIIQQSSTADLREEIQMLRETINALMEKVNLMPSPPKPQHPAATTLSYELPITTAVSPVTTTCPLYLPPLTTTMPQLMPPIQEQKQFNVCEYAMPFSYNMPYSAAQPMPQTTAIMNPLRTQSASFAQPSSTQVFASSTARMTPMVTTTNLPPNRAHMSVPQHTLDSRQLRKLQDLPEFSGLPEQWPMFVVAYRETTRNYCYTNLENLTRLQTALKGVAKSKVEAFLIHPDSVEQVISMLDFHYGRPQILIRSQIAKVRAFPTISGRKMYEVVNFSTMVSNLTTFLENAGAVPHLSNPTLLDELVNKLPLPKREEWMKYSINNLGQYPSVREFSLWLHEVATYISLVAEVDASTNDVICNKKEKPNPSFTITRKENRLTICRMCQQNHNLYQCEKFKGISLADRWKFVKNNNLCFGCLRAGHNSIKCQSRRQCNLSQCAKYHNRLLHDDVNGNVIKNVNRFENSESLVCANDVEKNKENEVGSVNTIIENSLNGKTFFKFLPVELRGPKDSVKIIAFVNEGSKISLLEEEVAKHIGLEGLKSNLCLSWIGGRTTNETSKKVNLEIRGFEENSAWLQMKNVYTTMNLKLPPQSLHIGKFKGQFSALNNIQIEDYFDARPKLLIGLPHIRLVRPFNVINLDECFAVHQTILGNVFFGSNEESIGSTVCRIDMEIMNDIQQQVTEYFTLENFGTKNLDPVVSNDDQRAEKILQSTTVKTNLQYETGLLWKNDDFKFKNSFQMAMERLQNVEARMRKDEDLDNWYKCKINDYILKSYARKLSPEEASIRNNCTWYLPHFVVKNINKGNKRRLVFDAAASVDGESFNTRLLKGPCKYQLTPLMSILFKFRQKQIGVCADIAEMFHRVRIRDKDQTAQRFLWRNGDDTKTPDEYVMQVMIFGSICSPCSAQYVKNLNAEIYKETHPKVYRAIVECHYVDDYVDSFDEINDAIHVCQDVVSIHKHAGFDLRGFVSNSKQLSKVPSAVLSGDRKPTKAEVFSLTISIFDPCGFLDNIAIISKILLHELWRYKVDWLSPIPDKVYTKWYAWYKELKNVQQIKIPRCYGLHFSTTVVDLHVFVDASEVAYAAVAYWRISEKDNADLVFVSGKSRCAPMKSLSIPRLELQAAVLGVRLKVAIVSHHDVKPKNIIFWSDSKTVIKWIRSDSRIYKQFVSHRIAEILDATDMGQWRWVPGLQNPADEATRSHSSPSDKCCWINGPKFLNSDEKHWPTIPNDVPEHDCESERRSKFLFTISEDPVVIFKRYSSYYKLIRIICWVRRAVKIFKSFVKPQEKSKAAELQNHLSLREVNASEIFLCIAQRDKYFEEYDQLKRNTFVSKASPIYKLNPFVDSDGLLRMSGRISNASCVERCTKEPIILPKNHELTNLLVKQYHEDFRQQNQESICAAIRIKFWIPSLRQVVRSAKRNCQLCKNMYAVPVPPLMGQLPMDRLTPFVRPFTYTGIDYMGPFMVAVGRRCEKRWVALFTCLTVRAIHLEISKDLSTDAVILCIRNFVNRRGLPIRIRSDRGTNFIGASKEKFIFEDMKVADECTRRGIEWLFNTPANPSAGGAWERMVRSVKNVLAFTLKEKVPQVETFRSLLIEAENLVNSRPLTHLPVENTDSEPLTPNHFLLGGPNLVQAPDMPEKVCLRKQWNLVQQLKQTFWKRWVLEYLPELTRRTKWHQPVKPICVGDVVIICADNEARGEWKRGVVQKVFTAADGQVRSAEVRTSCGNLKRPASKLAVLDVSSKSP